MFIVREPWAARGHINNIVILLNMFFSELSPSVYRCITLCRARNQLVSLKIAGAFLFSNIFRRAIIDGRGRTSRFVLLRDKYLYVLILRKKNPLIIIL